MLLETIEIPRPCERATDAKSRQPASAPARAALTGRLPEGLAFTERAAADLRDYLARAGLDGYRVFYNYCLDVEFDDVDEHLPALGQASAVWEPLPGMFDERAAAGVTELRVERGETLAHAPGCIRLDSHEVVLARWLWVNPADDCLTDVWLCAAPTPQHYVRLRDALRRLRHERSAADWRIVSGSSPGERVSRSSTGEADDLMLPQSLRERVEAEIVRFFSDEAAALYASLGVPYRRGVLLHGPPGNGKTSLIRHIGRQLPRAQGFILRPAAGFDTDDLRAVIRRWTSQAPGILVIEDLDWVLNEIEVSTFLNLIDGVDSATTGGLLLIGTTNHPEKLDPAISNRPGRFDIVLEVPAPDDALREAYLRRHLPGIPHELLHRVAVDTDGLAFAHLQEIMRLSGLLAINAGRSARSDDDVRAAARTVRDAFDDALRGFPGKPEMPFGLSNLHKERRRQHE